MKNIFTLLFFLLALVGYSQTSIIGKWKTIDDETGEARSVVEIYEKEGKYYGKIIEILIVPGEDPDPICEECEGERKGKKIIGMDIITDMKFNKSSGEFSKGEILDPENGNVYDCKLWVADDGNLKVRGYLLFFYRTQTWLPYSE